MLPRVVKALYLATVCFLPPLLLVLYPAIFLLRLQVPAWFIPTCEIYISVGFVCSCCDSSFGLTEED